MVEEQPGKSVIISGTKILDDAGCGSDDERDVESIKSVDSGVLVLMKCSTAPAYKSPRNLKSLQHLQNV
jgi:hypothetical protein